MLEGRGWVRRRHGGGVLLQEAGRGGGAAAGQRAGPEVEVEVEAEAVARGRPAGASYFAAAVAAGTAAAACVLSDAADGAAAATDAASSSSSSSKRSFGRWGRGDCNRWGPLGGPLQSVAQQLPAPHGQRPVRHIPPHEPPRYHPLACTSGARTCPPRTQLAAGGMGACRRRTGRTGRSWWGAAHATG